MGRNRGFDEASVVDSAAEVFVATGYEGTSIDDLVRATGLHRGSLYRTFGSKRGLFLAALRRVDGPGAQDLVLVALLELARRDAEVQALLSSMLREVPDPARLLGQRLLARAGLATVTADPTSPSIPSDSYRTGGPS